MGKPEIKHYPYQDLFNQSSPIPKHLKRYFTPAEIHLYEWQDYWLEIPGADRLRLGNRLMKAIRGDLFRIRFENQLGLAYIQPYKDSKPVADPLTVEVISSKFPTLEEHLTFFQGLLDDLFIKASRLSFSISAPTARGVSDAYSAPTPLFVYHFVCQYFPIFRDALRLIQTRPHKVLADLVEKVPLAQATEADPDVLISIIQNPSEWVPADGFPLAEKLQGFAPLHVRQYSSFETFDTPENRFILHFLRQILAAAQSLPNQRWWQQVPDERQLIVRSILSLVLQSMHHPMFSEVGQMGRLPLESQVLMRRDGYRDMLVLWQIFNHARKPLFAQLQQAIDLHDIASLYEIWVFFALTEEIAVLFGKNPEILLRDSEPGLIGRISQARFGSIGTLVYNQTLSTYSVPLRPDYAWYREGHLESVFDAKFRMERLTLERRDDDNDLELVSKRSDLYKMHTYRDALDISTAIAIYPGNVPVFHDKLRGSKTDIFLKDILTGHYMGIGALPMRPGNTELEV